MRLTRRGKKRLLIVGVFGTVVILAGAGYALYRTVYRDHRAKVAREEGLAAYEQGDYQTALDKLSYYLARFQDDTDALIAFADTRSKVPADGRSHIPSAIRYYDAARRQDPQNQMVLERLLDLYAMVRGGLNPGMEVARQLFELDPNHVDAAEALMAGHIMRGEHGYGSESSPGAAYYSERLCAIEPTNLRHKQAHLSNLDRAGWTTAQLNEIVEDWAAEDATGDGGLDLLRAVVAALDDRPEDVKLAVDEAIANGAATRERLDFMVLMLDLFGLNEEADALLASADFDDDPAFYEMRIRRDWQAGRFSAATDALDKALSKFSEPTRGLLKIGALVYASSRQQDRAVEVLNVLRQLVREAPPEDRAAGESWVNALEARLKISKDNWLETINAYDAAILANTDENDPILPYLKGEAFYAAGDHDSARMAFLQAYDRSNRMWVAAGASYIECLMQLGQFKAAHEEARQLVAMGASILEPWRLFFDSWLALEERGLSVAGNVSVDTRAELVRILEAFVDQNEAAADLLIPRLVRAYLLTGETGEVKATIEQALASDKTSPATVEDLALLSLSRNLGFDEVLIERFEEVAVDFAGYQGSLANLKSQHLLKQGRPEQGLEIIDALIAADPSRSYWRLRTQFLVSAELPGVEAAIEELLKDPEASVHNLSWILTLPQTWEDEALVLRAQNRLVYRLGYQPSSEDVDDRRYVLSEATRVLQFESDDTRQVSEQINRLNAELKRTPQSLPVLTTLAALHLVEQPPDSHAAIRHLKTAITYFPGEVHLYPRLIALLQRVGDFQEAERVLRQLSGRPDLNPELRAEQVRLLQKQGDFDGAFAQLSLMMGESGQPVSQLDRLRLASLALRAGDRAEARRVIDEALAASEVEGLVLRFAANLYALQGETDRAIELLETRRATGEMASRDLLLGLFWFDQGNPERAQEHLEKATGNDPANASAWLFLAQLHLARGDAAAAQRAALAGLEHAPQNTQLHAVLASAGLGGDRTARRDAIAKLITVVGEDDAVVQTLRLFDRVATNDGLIAADQEELAAARRLVRDFPDFLPAWRLAVTAHVAAKERVQALDLITGALSKMPTRPEPAMWGLELHRDGGRIVDAVRYARIWRERSLDDPLPADLTIAALEIARGDNRAALAAVRPHTRQIISQRDIQPERLSLLVQVLLRNGEVDEAFDLVQLDDPPRDDLLLAWIETTATMGIDAGARALTAIEPLSTDTNARKLNLATAWIMLGERSERDDFFSHGERLALGLADAEGEDRLAALRLRAMLASARKDFEGAASIYMQVLATHPEDALALNNLAYVLAVDLAQPAAAVEYSERLVRLYPDVPDFLDTHAAVLQRVQRSAEAERFARRALAGRPADPEIMLTLAAILLDLTPNDPEARQLFIAAEQSIRSAPFVDPALTRKLETIRDRLESAP